MDKKTVVVLLLVFLFYFVSKKASSQEKPGETAPGDLGPLYDKNGVIFFSSVPYTIKKGDWLSKKAKEILGSQYNPESMDRMTRAIADFNGFDNSLFDSIPSELPGDPDTLSVGQVIELPVSWAINPL